jgi:hypothetical protein
MSAGPSLIFPRLTHQFLQSRLWGLLQVRPKLPDHAIREVVRGRKHESLQGNQLA